MKYYLTINTNMCNESMYLFKGSVMKNKALNTEKMYCFTLHDITQNICKDIYVVSVSE